MTLATRHPHRDVRPWLNENPHAVDAYAASRIKDSYDHIAEVLKVAHPEVRYGSVLDVGCGTGHESFGLAAYFDDVVAIDTMATAIRRARRVARRAGISNVHFRKANAEKYRYPRRFDLVFSNLMSHAASSRDRLVSQMRMAMQDDGWLLYGEVCEGYAPLEIHRAIARRDVRALRGRVRQVLSGFRGTPTVRFYLAGTASGLLGRLGLSVEKRKVETWNCLPFHDFLWCRASGRSPVLASQIEHPDYAEVDPDFRQIQEVFAGVMARRSTKLRGDDRSNVEDVAYGSSNRFAPFLIYLLIADLVLPSLRTAPSTLDRLRVRVPSPRRSAAVDWESITALDEAFIRLVRERAGCAAEVIDT